MLPESARISHERRAKSAYHGSSRTNSLFAARCSKAFDFRFDHRAINDAGGAMSGRQAGDERLKSLLAFFVQSGELRNRLGMVVDTKIERGIILGRRDQQCGGLLAALVASCPFSRMKRYDQAFSKGTRCCCFVCGGSGRN